MADLIMEMRGMSMRE